MILNHNLKVKKSTYEWIIENINKVKIVYFHDPTSWKKLTKASLSEKKSNLIDWTEKFKWGAKRELHLKK